MRQLPPLAAAAASAAASAAAAAPDTAAVCMSKLLLLRAAAADAGRNSEIIALSGGWGGHNSWVPGSSRANYGRSLSPLGPHHYSNQPQRLHIIGIGNDVFYIVHFIMLTIFNVLKWFGHRCAPLSKSKSVLFRKSFN